MKVLVIGSGAREHAMAWTLRRDPNVTAIVCAPGNPGIAAVARCVPVDVSRPEAMHAIAEGEQVDLTVVGPEVPLSHGVADLFAANGRPIVGPTRAAAALESSKAFAKDFMARHRVPTAGYAVVDSADDALAFVARGEFGYPLVIKADGLAAGKGVVIAADLPDAESQVQSMMVDKRFGQAGARLVIEELLVGREASFFVLSDGTRALPLGSAEDHKRALDGDAGSNTGGMGAYAPSSVFDAATQTRVMDEIVLPVLDGMRSEGSEFRGFLFVGLMLTVDGPRVIEFNVRFGDPEAQVILPMIGDDLGTLLMSAAAGELETSRVSLEPAPRVGVVIASGGYPDTYDTGKVIHGIEDAEAIPDVNVFHSGTAKRGSEIVTAGGRVLTVVASGGDYRSAIDRAYEAVGKISFDGMHYRKDIGAKALR
jgi:phosphoribosylamine--glycine ligase